MEYHGFLEGYPDRTQVCDVAVPAAPVDLGRHVRVPGPFEKRLEPIVYTSASIFRADPGEPLRRIGDLGGVSWVGPHRIYALSLVDDELRVLPVQCGAAVSVSETTAPTAPTALRPNPAARGDVVQVTLTRPGNHVLTVYDAAGRQVQTVEGSGPQLTWDLHDRRGTPVGEGVYFTELRHRGRVLDRGRLTVLR